MSAGKGTELPVHQTGNQARISVGLPRGVARWQVRSRCFRYDAQGDASYGFLLAVE